jgi:hypothetical protein
MFRMLPPCRAFISMHRVSATKTKGHCANKRCDGSMSAEDTDERHNAEAGVVTVVGLDLVTCDEAAIDVSCIRPVAALPTWMASSCYSYEGIYDTDMLVTLACSRDWLPSLLHPSPNWWVEKT